MLRWELVMRFLQRELKLETCPGGGGWKGNILERRLDYRCVQPVVSNRDSGLVRPTFKQDRDESGHWNSRERILQLWTLHQRLIWLKSQQVPHALIHFVSHSTHTWVQNKNVCFMWCVASWAHHGPKHVWCCPAAVACITCMYRYEGCQKKKKRLWPVASCHRLPVCQRQEVKPQTTSCGSAGGAAIPSQRPTTSVIGGLSIFVVTRKGKAVMPKRSKISRTDLMYEQIKSRGCYPITSMVPAELSQGIIHDALPLLRLLTELPFLPSADSASI